MQRACLSEGDQLSPESPGREMRGSRKNSGRRVSAGKRLQTRASVQRRGFVGSRIKSTNFEGEQVVEASAGVSLEHCLEYLLPRVPVGSVGKYEREAVEVSNEPLQG